MMALKWETNNMDYYEVIKEYYGNKRAKRSGFLYMDHINHGIALLKAWNVSQEYIDVWCLHPIMQDDLRYADYLTTGLGREWKLAAEYRAIANAYLPRHNPRDPEISIDPGINTLLKVDKLHNSWQFYQALNKNPDIYTNRARLTFYFMGWLNALKVTYKDEIDAYDLFETLEEG
jgi:hypothetical protein